MSYFQTLSGALHWPSIITAFGWIVTTISIAAGLHLSRIERMSIKSINGTLVVIFDTPVPANKVWQSTDTLFGVGVLKKAPLTSSAFLGTLTVTEINIRNEANQPAHGDALATSLHLILNSQPRLFPSGLGKIPALKFTEHFDYLSISSLLGLPAGTSFRGNLYLVINDTLQLNFDIPTHHINEVTQLLVPLNSRARQLMNEYKMFNGSAEKLTHSVLTPNLARD